jgi:hypothetical protein
VFADRQRETKKDTTTEKESYGFDDIFPNIANGFAATPKDERETTIISNLMKRLCDMSLTRENNRNTKKYFSCPFRSVKAK